MGLDLWMVPVRLDSAPMRRIRDSAAAWEEAVAHPPFTSRADGKPVPALNRELLALLPAGYGLSTPFPRRSHEHAEYLLDPAGLRRIRTWEEHERALPYRIVHGDRPFAAHARGVQGISWRCSTAGFLADAAARIDALDVERVRGEFSVADMVELPVYKAPYGPDDEVFATTLAELRALGEEYRRLADAGLDLVVVLD